MFADMLARSRARAEALMVDTCTIRRVSGSVTDPDTGVVSPDYSVVYSGLCKVQSTQPQAQTPTAGEHKWTIQQGAVHIPALAPAVMVGDEVVLDSSAHDPHLVGRSFRVVELLHKTWATAQRLNVEEVTS